MLVALLILLMTSTMAFAQPRLGGGGIISDLSQISPSLCADSEGLFNSGGTAWVCSAGGGGSGDISGVFDCSTGDCSSIALSDGDLLDFSAVEPETATEGLILPQSTICEDISSAAGQVCFDSLQGELWVGGGIDAVLIGPTPVPSLNSAYTVGATIFGADSLNNAVKITDDGTNTMSLFISSGQPTIEGDCDGSPCPTIIAKTGGTVTIDDSFNVTLETGAKERFSHPLLMANADVDGTQCSAPAGVSIGSGVVKSVVCTDNDAGSIYFSFPLPGRWDAGSFVLDWYLVNTNATPADDYDIDWSAQCRGLGEAIGTFSSEQGTDFDFDASGSCGGSACDADDVVRLTTAAIEPSGTCAKGDFIIVRGQIDATGTTTSQVADVYHIGGRLKWLADDWSD